MAIFIDGSNLYLSGKRAGKILWPPDIPKLVLPSVDGDINPVVKTHYFSSIDRTSSRQQRFLNHISKSGIIIYDFDLKCYPDDNTCPSCNNSCAVCGRDLRTKPHKEKMVDIALGTAMIEAAYQKDPCGVDTIIIVSGDKDLIPAIQLVRKKLGKEVLIAGYRENHSLVNSLAYELDKEVDKVINLLDL